MLGRETLILKVDVTDPVISNEGLMQSSVFPSGNGEAALRHMGADRLAMHLSALFLSPIVSVTNKYAGNTSLTVYVCKTLDIWSKIEILRSNLHGIIFPIGCIAISKRRRHFILPFFLRNMKNACSNFFEKHENASRVPVDWPLD